eukprot:COSAG02_NODE_467_length_21771_cov_39.020303_7_plen_116_part_00
MKETSSLKACRSSLHLHRVFVLVYLRLRQGWEAKVSSSTGATYYYCEATDESTWEMPTEAGGGLELQHDDDDDDDDDDESHQETVQMDAETAVRQLPAPAPGWSLFTDRDAVMAV